MEKRIEELNQFDDIKIFKLKKIDYDEPLLEIKSLVDISDFILDTNF